ncbi:MAG: hypothetical protein J6R22_04360 [Alphaproteobacteria bacterium]|nr:hypothetical protein [Alphaproteobacteria bacterium]
MNKSNKIKFHTEQKESNSKTAVATKAIGLLTTCAGVATIVACFFQKDSDSTMNLAPIAIVEVLLGTMCLRISHSAKQQAMWHRKQIRKIQKQK